MSKTNRYYYPRSTGPNDEKKLTQHGCICTHGLGEWNFNPDCGYHNAAKEQPWNHSIPWNCPTYWDCCNCLEYMKTKTWEELVDEVTKRVRKWKLKQRKNK